MLVVEKVVRLFPPHVRHRRLPRGGRVWMAVGCEMLALKLLQAVLLVLVPFLLSRLAG